jgi:hypothetical protein
VHSERGGNAKVERRASPSPCSFPIAPKRSFLACSAQVGVACFSRARRLSHVLVSCLARVVVSCYLA